jgi:hypothetical protein
MQVFFYSSKTFANIGLHEDHVYWGILSTGLINLLATVCTVKLIEFYGRRPLILYPLLIITGVMVLMCILVEIDSGRSSR